MSQDQIPRRSDWKFLGVNLSDPMPDKESLASAYNRYMLDRTLKIFEWGNLPDTMNKRDLELQIQWNGYATIAKCNGELYSFNSNLGGEPNPYYMPTLSIVSNPALKFNEELIIDRDCIVIPNDSLYTGLRPMFSKYSNLLAETDISLKIGCWNNRVLAMVTANDDTTRKSAEMFFEDIIRGDKIGVIAGDAFVGKALESNPYGNASNTNIKDIIELQQYLKSHWYLDLGLNANYNMKREAINSTESGMNEDSLTPLIDDMLENRKIAAEKINAMFGTSITVKLSPIWEKVREEILTPDVGEPMEDDGGDDNGSQD